MDVNPCTVCGSTDLNLIDGYYYCVECGTQDSNVRETMFEDRYLEDGGNLFVQKRTKIKIIKEDVKMCGEWHKWHAYNCILAGLTEELISIGAKPSIKTKVLWLWSLYMKKYQNKKELGLGVEDIQNDTSTSQDIDNVDIRGIKRKIPLGNDVSFVCTRLLLTILYLALHFDCSDIQLTHLLRYVQEGKLSFHTCTKYLPIDIDVSLFSVYNRSLCLYYVPSMQLMRFHAMSFIKTFSLEAPVLQNVTNLVDQYIRELCLPNDFKRLVYSLMHYFSPNKFLIIDHAKKKTNTQMPFYECTVMSYILFALKMCFGLDDVYDVKLSEIVDNINQENAYMKSYKLGGSSESSDRLFSFHEWCNFLQFRKIILCKYCCSLAELYYIDTDDYVFMEQRKVKIPCRKKPSFSDKTTMNILDNIPVKTEFEVIPKSKFVPTLTPLTTYTDIVLQYYKDPELRLLLSEDFTQYSIKYACSDLKLYSQDSNNAVVGINIIDQNIKSGILGLLKGKVYDTEMVFIRHCDNKNWTKTNRPTLKHIKKVNNYESDKESVYTNDSTENIVVTDFKTARKSGDTQITEDHREIEDTIIEEDKDVNIFDDNFLDFEKEIKTEFPEVAPGVENSFENTVQYNDSRNEDELNIEIENISSKSTQVSDADYFYNPDTFDREKTIDDIILFTCKKYKIPIPLKESKPKEPRKRKPKFINDEGDVSKAKRTKRSTNHKDVQKQINDLLFAYYSNLQKDKLNTVSANLKNLIQTYDDDKIEDDLVANELNAGYKANEVITDTQFINEHQQNSEVQSITEVTDINQTGNSDILDIPETNDNNSLSSNCNDFITDPKFDEEVYDVKQLYVKVPHVEETDLENVFNTHGDPNLENILDKKIKEGLNIHTEKLKSDVDSFCSEDEIPLSVIKNQKKMRAELKSKTLNFLIKNREEIKTFNYWTRSYPRVVSKTGDLNNRFIAELHENFPKSFAFIMEECAGILGCSSANLYRSFNALEQSLLPSKY
ncbi:uncharacterized protein LOC131841292 [Achroia grisella]|uniref:uncharacterized protein LOC131841292 n=1 Tax=Achroia grisella TaxID=688607 RepID=UPI0027D2525B|nr:uncharacterized protein LOC131841292 [Achroia grisella]